MMQILLAFIVISLISQKSVADIPSEVTTEQVIDSTFANENFEQNLSKTTKHDIEQVIRNFERIEELTQNNFETKPDGIADDVFTEMVRSVESLIENVQDLDFVYGFLYADGLSRVVSENLATNNAKLKRSLLLLTKTLFEKATVACVDFAPLSLLDKTLDIFTDDENLAHKAFALEILNCWLPNNPKLQERVMKIKGLEPFYEHIGILDNMSIRTILSLFSRILIEHLEVRNKKEEMTNENYNKFVMYKRIGLIERMSTLPVCRGLLEIFRRVIAYSYSDNDVILPVLELVPNVHNFCRKRYKGNYKAIDFYTGLIDFVKDPKNGEYFFVNNVDTEKFNEMFNAFKDEVKGEKDEF